MARPSAAPRPFVGRSDEAMKCQQADGQARRPEQLDVQQMGEDVRAEAEADAGDNRRRARADQIADQIVGADRAHQKREQDDEGMGGVGIARRPVDRDGERARPQVRLRIRQRQPVRIEDIGVEDMERVEHQRRARPRRRSRSRIDRRRCRCDTPATRDGRPAETSGAPSTRRTRAARWRTRAVPPCVSEVIDRQASRRMCLINKLGSIPRAPPRLCQEKNRRPADDADNVTSRAWRRSKPIARHG